jgi:hypothetical protein
MADGPNDLIEKLASDPEHYLITKPAREFASMSLGNVVERTIHRRHGLDSAALRPVRTQWVADQFPNEVWDLPMLIALYIGEACSCYVNGEYFATLALCHAINESFVSGIYRAAKKSRKRSWRKLLDDLGNLTPAGKTYLIWVAKLRHALLHVGSRRDYAKAIRVATTPITFKEKILPIPAIDTLCKIALSISIELVGSSSVHKG